jgi:hypothetical protein
MKRYSIYVREYGSNRDVLLAELDSNPDPIAEALRRNTLAVQLGGRRVTRTPKYSKVEIVETASLSPADEGHEPL